MFVPPSPSRPADFGPRIVEIPLGDIYVGGRLREIDLDWASALAANFEAGGQPPPVEVRVPDLSEGIAAPFALVVGGHRMEAFRLLGRSQIRAEIRVLTPLQARLVEVEENLFRHELNALDRAIFLTEHKKVWGELHPETSHGGDRKSQKNNGQIKSQTLALDPKRFTFEAAKRCNLSEATVKAAIALVAALTPETITLLRGTETARNASELKRLAEEPPERQPLIAKALREGKAPNVAAARIAAGVAPTGEGDPQEALFRCLCSNWSKADRKTRARFVEHAGLVERKPRERMPKVSEIVPERAAPSGQIDLEEAISKAGPRS